MAEKQEIEQQLQRAMCARLQHFKDQADSLTMESVRRLLEKDLGLEKLALDAHKRFIRLYLEKKISDGDDCKSGAATEDADEDARLSKATVLPKQHEKAIDTKNSGNGDEETMEDSPIMGVLSPKSEVATQGPSISESSIKKAIWERADHFEANSANITLAGVRRLLEEDLGLDKNTLDPFKKFIGQQIDQVLSSPKRAKSVKVVKKIVSDNSKVSKTVSSEEESDSSHCESEEMEVKAQSKKEAASKGKTKKVEQSKKRKLYKGSDLDVTGKKQNKVTKREKEENNSGDDGSAFDDGKSRSSVEKSGQRKETAASGYGKKVENLKSIIKACGMSVAPSVYKKAKQVPDEEREAFIVTEFEGILMREGLSKNPTEKEIKDCKKRKDRARELEGIDMSNIISSSRRRSTFSFGPPVTPSVTPGIAKRNKVDAKDTNEKDNNDKDNKNDSKQADKNEEEENKKEKEKEKAMKEKDHVQDDEVEDDDEGEDDEEEEDESDEFDEDDDEDSD